MTGMYVHVPFCEKKCSYCDFYSLESTQHIDRFVETVCAELNLRAAGPHSKGTITSIFFGGGTPSLLSPKQLGAILDTITLHWNIAPDAEITMECNPGTVTLNNLKGYASWGVNRLSFGVQSFIAEELAFLQRIHSADEAVEAMDLARAAGFSNVNMDLMFALPPQTMESLATSLQRMIALQPDHISAYSLIYEHGTPLYAQLKKGLVQPLPDDTDAEMYASVIDTLTGAGYGQYEVSNFALAGKRCQHNLTYWHAQPYWAVGPSAHGYLDNTRYWNIRSLTAWTQHVQRGELPLANFETLAEKERLSERIFLALRADGLDVESIRREFHVDIREALQPDLAWWIGATMMHDSGTHLALTSEGYRVCDDITVKAIAAIEKWSVRSHRIGNSH
jgi:oxygen-independent coproporphyrinogen-3 oxidase